MSEVFVGLLEDFESSDRRIVKTTLGEIGVFRQNGDFFAYENVCPHQGGPACRGIVIGKVEAIVAPDRRILGEQFSEEEFHIVCPWHGWEFDIKTGECPADPSYRLRSFEVSIRGDKVYVVE